MNRHFLLKGVLALSMTIGSLSVALGHQGARGIVLERMEAMKAMADALKSLKEVAQGQNETPEETIRRALRILHDHSGSAMTQLFPAGSRSPRSEASMTIWQEWQGFEEKAQDLRDIVLSLRGEDPELSAPNRAREALGHLGPTCKGCHERYRIEK